MSRWFRHYAGMMRDDKLVRVAIRSGQTIERVVWIFGAILESAAEIDDEGRYEVDAPEIAYFLRAPETDVVAVIAGLEAVGRICGSAVVKWSNRQFSSDRSADRQKRHRDKKREETAAGNNADLGQPNSEVTPKTGRVTSLSRHGDAPETELETETEVSEPKGSSPRPWALPLGVSLQVWTDFLGNRKRKRQGNTPTAWKAFQDDLKRVASRTGIPPPKLIEHAAAKGWGSINAPDEDQGHGRTNGMGRNQPSDGLSPTTRAAVAVFGPPGASEQRRVPQ